jgi:ABC-2 type transport system permease protein/lipopolysaccharide transport system permease protein
MLQQACSDVLDGFRAWPLWGLLGWNEIRQRYRRSLLGPFWLTASTAILIVALGVIYSRIFHTEIDKFLPYLCVGLLIWGFISSILAEAGALFTGSESFIKQVKLPFTVYACKFIWSRLIILGHNFIIYFGVLIYFTIWPGAVALAALPGLFLVSLNALFACIFLGMISARFRDIPQIMNSLIQVVFFLTPIMWKPEYIGNNSALVLFNPFYHLIEIVRAPLLGSLPTLSNYLAVLVVTVANFLLASTFFVRYRMRIVYWV